MTKQRIDILDISDFHKLPNNSAKIKYLLEFAILAPSTHNTQPWLFKLDNDCCEIFYDKKRFLKYADKKKKNIKISIGAAIENLILASTYYNCFRAIQYIEVGGKVARIEFVFDKQGIGRKGNISRQLVEAITRRGVFRGVFLDKKIDLNLIDHLKKVSQEYRGVFYLPITAEKLICDLAELTAIGTRIASSNYKFREELSTWIAHQYSGKKDGIPTQSLNIPGHISVLFPYVIKKLDLGFITSKIVRKNYRSAQIINLVWTNKNSTKELIDVGRLSQRIMLELVNEGLSVSIAVGGIEMDATRPSVKKSADINGFPQFVFGAGYAKKLLKPTPRIPVAERIINS